MAAAIRIELPDRTDARDLLDAFARRGLTGRLTAVDGRVEVEIAYRREDQDRLAREASAALEAWAGDRGLDGATIRSGETASRWRPELGSVTRSG
jgi:hypothetical protein